MSLRLGRASFIQDFDISLPFFTESTSAQTRSQGQEMLAYWVKVSRVQGQTYEKLFSPGAFLQSPEERARIAIELVDAMNQAWYERDDAHATDFSDVGPTPGVYVQKSGTRNTKPNETEPPSRRKRKVRRSFSRSMDANEDTESKPQQSSKPLVLT